MKPDNLAGQFNQVVINDFNIIIRSGSIRPSRKHIGIDIRQGVASSLFHNPFMYRQRCWF